MKTACLLLSLTLFCTARAGAQVLSGQALSIGSGHNAPQRNAVIGNGNNANAWNGIAVGEYNYLPAGGNNSGAVGGGNHMGAVSSFAAGYGNGVTGYYNIALGQSNSIAAGAGFSANSLVAGYYNTATGVNGVMMGGGLNVATGTFSATFGYALANTFNHATVVGKHNLSTGFAPANPPLFVVGNGPGDLNNNNNSTDPGERKNALVVLANGDVLIPKAQGDISMGEFGN